MERFAQSPEFGDRWLEMEQKMQVISVNVGAKEAISVSGREKVTGIYKRSVDHTVEVKRLGVTGDQIVDKKHHGGPDQAVYLYRAEDYEYWASELGHTVAPGTFGENLTISGLPSPGLNIGDRLQFEKVVLEITAPRIPCSIFAARMGDPGFVKAFVRAERPGFYARVVTEGTLKLNDRFTLLSTRESSISTVQMYRDLLGKPNANVIRDYLALPISSRVREDFEARLRKLAS